MKLAIIHAWLPMAILMCHFLYYEPRFADFYRIRIKWDRYFDPEENILFFRL